MVGMFPNNTESGILVLTLTKQDYGKWKPSGFLGCSNAGDSRRRMKTSSVFPSSDTVHCRISAYSTCLQTHPRSPAWPRERWVLHSWSYMACVWGGCDNRVEDCWDILKLHLESPIFVAVEGGRVHGNLLLNHHSSCSFLGATRTSCGLLEHSSWPEAICSSDYNYVFSVSLSLSLCVFVSLSCLPLCLSLPVCLPVSVSVSLMCLFLSLPLSLSRSLILSLSLCFSISLFIDQVSWY